MYDTYYPINISSYSRHFHQFVYILKWLIYGIAYFINKKDKIFSFC